MEFTTLTDAQCDALGVTTQDVIGAIEDAVRGKASGTVWAAPKASVLPGDGRYAMATLAGSDDLGVVAVKSVLVCPDNADKGLAGINGAIMLLDAPTGVLRAVMGANWVTAVRTAGLSAVMAARLANPDSRSVGFIGTGVQAHSHLAAFAQMFPLQQIYIYGRGRANIDKLAQAAAALGLKAKICDTAQGAIKAADIVVTSITLDYTIEPFLDANWLKAGAFAAVTDLAIPWVDEGMGAFDAIYVDDRAQEAAMEKPMVDPALIKGDLSSVVLGQTPAKFDADQRQTFVFRGLALGDLAIAGLAYQRSQA